VEVLAKDIVPAVRRTAAKRYLLASPVLAITGFALDTWVDNLNTYGVLKQRVETCNGMIPEPGWILPLAGLGVVMAVAGIAVALAGRVLLRPAARVTRADLPFAGVVFGLVALGWTLGARNWIDSEATAALLLIAAASVVTIVVGGAVGIAMCLWAPPGVKRHTSWLVPATISIGLLAVLFTVLTLSAIYRDAPTTAARLCFP
jgi:hypothetical protein